MSTYPLNLVDLYHEILNICINSGSGLTGVKRLQRGKHLRKFLTCGNSCLAGVERWQRASKPSLGQLEADRYSRRRLLTGAQVWRRRPRCARLTEPWIISLV